MSIQFETVTDRSIRWPYVTFDEVSVAAHYWQRRLQVYGDVLYAEYYIAGSNGANNKLILYERLTVDIYLITGGNMGGSSTTALYGNGGLAGVQATFPNITLEPGTYYSFNKQTSANLYDINKKVDIVKVSHNNTAKTFAYYLYGDTRYPAGTTTLPTNGTSSVPGLGGQGCLVFGNPVNRPDWYFTGATAVTSATRATSIGVGSGGCGAQRCLGTATNISGTTGGYGLCMIRVPLTTVVEDAVYFGFQ